MTSSNGLPYGVSNALINLSIEEILTLFRNEHSDRICSLGKCLHLIVTELLFQYGKLMTGTLLLNKRITMGVCALKNADVNC